jgi:exodeoxyribonuclease VIII
MTDAKPQAVISKPGIYFDVPFEQYIEIPGINNSILKILTQKSPRHARWAKDHDRDTKEMLFGRLVHTLLLEPDKVADEYRVHAEINRNTKIWKAFEQETLDGGFQPIQQGEYDSAKRISALILEQPVHRFVRKGHAEVTLVWEDEETGLLCKARVDYVHRDVDMGEAGQGDFLIDVKTAADASPEGFSKACYNLNYYQQAAMSSQGWEILTDHTPTFTFLAIEKKEPYAAVAYETQAKTMDAGLVAYRDALKRYKQCLDEERWPGYASEVLPLDIPEWALKRAGISDYQVHAL